MKRLKRGFTALIFAAVLLLSASTASAQPNATMPLLHPLFTDNMVLQRDAVIPIWGWTKSGQEIQVSFQGKSTPVRAGTDGKWLAKVGPFPAGGPYELTVSGLQTITLKNVLVGDVWLCSGQSNMWVPVKDAANGAAESAQSDFPQIRFFAIAVRASVKERSTFKETAAWQTANPATVKDFSAVAFFFGRHLHQNLKVPIGLIHASAGATTAEAWSSAEALKTTPDGERRIAEFTEWKDLLIEWDKYDADPALFERLMADWYLENDPGSAKNASWSISDLNDADWKTMELPGAWHSCGLPGFEGVVWFRKEFEIPAALQGKNLVLWLGGIDRRDTAWINGTQVGQSTSNGWKREYRVPANLLKDGRNVVTVRILGSSGFQGAPNDLRMTQSGDNVAAAPLSLAGTWRYKESISLRTATRPPSLRSGNPSIPTALYNGGIAPLLPFAIKGAIWYQGESNASNPGQYRRLLPAMIKDWRARFGVGDFPFLIVQLAGFGTTHEQPSDSSWAQFREAQADIARKVHNSGLAVAIDIGDAKDVHPKNKQDVGNRLGLVAQAVAYGQKVEYSGPAYQSMKIEGNAIRLSFAHAESLSSRASEKLLGFAIAGADRKWAWADAKIEGKDVIVSSPLINTPTAVRYAWDDSPVGNLTNKANLPAVPFRTDAPNN